MKHELTFRLFFVIYCTVTYEDVTKVKSSWEIPTCKFESCYYSAVYIQMTLV